MQPARKSRPVSGNSKVASTSFGPTTSLMQDNLHHDYSAQAQTLKWFQLFRNVPPRRHFRTKHSDKFKTNAHDEHFIQARKRDQLIVKFPESGQKTFAITSKIEEDALEEYETREDVNRDCTSVTDLDFGQFVDDNDTDSSSCSSSDFSNYCGDDESWSNESDWDSSSFSSSTSSNYVISDYSGDSERSSDTDTDSEEFSDDFDGENSSGPAYALAFYSDRVEKVFLSNEAESIPPPLDVDKDRINYNSHGPFSAGFDFAMMNRAPSTKVQNRRSDPFCAIKFNSPKLKEIVIANEDPRRTDDRLPRTFHFPRRHTLPPIFAPLTREEMSAQWDL